MFTFAVSACALAAVYLIGWNKGYDASSRQSDEINQRLKDNR